MGDDSRPSIGIARMGLALRALRESTDATLDSASYEGRPAWTVTAPVAADIVAGAQQAVVVVDKETGFPLQVTFRAGGRDAQRFSLHDVRVSPTFGATDLEVEWPKGAAVQPDSVISSLRRTSLDEARKMGDYAIILPESLPEGFPDGRSEHREGTAV